MLGVGDMQESKVPADYVEELEEVLHQTHTIARGNLHNAQARQKRTYDMRLHNHAYDVGDLVYMIDSSTKIGQSKKLCKPWIGPYVVEEKLSSILYRIRDCKKSKVVHHDRLKLCSDREIPLWLSRLRHNISLKFPWPKPIAEDPIEDLTKPSADGHESEMASDGTSGCQREEPAKEATKRPQRNIKLPKTLADFDLSS
jgi:hypothetical protein